VRLWRGGYQLDLGAGRYGAGTVSTKGVPSFEPTSGPRIPNGRMAAMQLLPFIAVALVVVLTPGADMALVTKNALLYGRAAAIATALGVNAGVAMWALATAIGLAAVVRSSHALFTVIKVLGAAYLVYLGVHALMASRRAGADPDPEAKTSRVLSRLAAFRQGLLGNLLNPKIAVLFTSLLPQFVGPNASAGALLLLGAVFNAMGLAWLLTYAALAARSRALLRRPRVKAFLDRLSGLVLVGVGVRLAFEGRP
jgi:RhtB (resistance to homoserine/threonine) family protein